jgi:hypothetical protein
VSKAGEMQLFSKNQLQNFRQNKYIDNVPSSMTKEEEATMILNAELLQNPRKYNDPLRDSRESFSNQQAQEIIQNIPAMPLQFISNLNDK